MTAILYSTAYSQDGELIKAKEALPHQLYICPNPECRSQLIFKGGKIKRPHFAHKVLPANCSPETALHYTFKNLLFLKISKQIESNAPLPLEWQCSICDEPHSGNLLKKATQVKLEYDLKVCQPDLALLDNSGNVVAALEVIVTHSPEQYALDFYQSNNIVLIQYILKTDEDVNRLDGSILSPDKVAFCLRPKCTNCGKHMSKRQLLLIDTNCYRCFSPMIVAVAGWDNFWVCHGNYDDNDIKEANKRGAYIISRYSRTLNMTYKANTCKKCRAFIGNHYLIDYVCSDSKEVVNLGYFCQRCFVP